MNCVKVKKLYFNNEEIPSKFILLKLGELDCVQN